MGYECERNINVNDDAGGNNNVTFMFNAISGGISALGSLDKC